MRVQKLLSFLVTPAVAGLAASVAVLAIKPGSPPPKPCSSPPQEQTKHAPPNVFPASGPVSYAEAVTRAAPSLVNIYTTKITTEEKLEPIADPLLRRFYGQRYSLQRHQRRQNSLGSGVIVRPEGYLLTNYHIIEGAKEIEVVLASGESVPVRMVGKDPETDLAVLKIEAGGDFPPIALGDSEVLSVGDVVLAIGNPYGVGQTVTLGIVSATGRRHLGINTYENFIQTDAAINPGNSGGALINAQGEMVGINTVIYSQSGGSQGIGFAIPTALARDVLEQIIRHGHVVRGWLGITGQDVTEDLASSFGLHGTAGILVTRVLKGGPAAQAGIWPGDVVTHLDGTMPKGIDEALNIIARKPPGSTLHLEGWRGNRRLDIYPVVSERPPRPVGGRLAERTN